MTQADRWYTGLKYNRMSINLQEWDSITHLIIVYVLIYWHPFQGIIGYQWLIEIGDAPSVLNSVEHHSQEWKRPLQGLKATVWSKSDHDKGVLQILLLYCQSKVERLFYCRAEIFYTWTLHKNNNSSCRYQTATVTTQHTPKEDQVWSYP